MIPERHKLKPCPFCGGEAEYEISLPNWDDACNVRVKCKTEGCYANMLNGWQLNEMIAAEKWNKRDTEERLSKHVQFLLDIINRLPDATFMGIVLGEKTTEELEDELEKKNWMYNESVIRPAERRNAVQDTGGTDQT
jgi:hypothetical protein